MKSGLNIHVRLGGFIPKDVSKKTWLDNQDISKQAEKGKGNAILCEYESGVYTLCDLNQKESISCSILLLFSSGAADVKLTKVLFICIFRKFKEQICFSKKKKKLHKNNIATFHFPTVLTGLVYFSRKIYLLAVRFYFLYFL